MATTTNFNCGKIFDSRDYWEDEDTDICSMEFEDTLELLDEEQTAETAKIEGTLGLWDGKHEIEPVFEDTVSQAVKRCLGDCPDIVIEKTENNKLEITTLHHDGRNSFTITY